VNYNKVEDLQKALWDCTAIAHLAGIAHARPAPDDRQRYHQGICDATTNLLQAASAVGCQRFVFASTIKVYGESSGSQVLNENSPTLATSIYGQCKIEAERIVLGFSKQISTVIFRLPPLFGKGMKGSVRHFFRAARYHIPLPLHNLRQHRHFLFVNNASALILAAIKGEIKPGLYNVFDPYPWTMGEFYQVIYDAIHNRPLPRYLAWRLPALCEHFLMKVPGLAALMNPFELASNQATEWQRHLSYSPTDGLKAAAQDLIPSLNAEPSLLLP
jgi:UDP-glucose 4-epimerase